MDYNTYRVHKVLASQNQQPFVYFYRAFDHNGDGSISKDELKDAMVRFGQTFSQDEAEEMFRVSKYKISYISILYNTGALKCD